MKIEEKIRTIREIKGISQEAVATHLAITQQAYGKIERGETKLDLGKLEEIATYFGVKSEDIINFDEKNIFNNTFNNHHHSTGNNHSTGNFYLSESEKQHKIIERTLSIIEGRFDRHDKIVIIMLALIFLVILLKSVLG